MNFFTGANPTSITSIGRTAIGLACLKGYSEALRLLLLSCSNHSTITSVTPSTFSSKEDDGESEAKKWKKFDQPIAEDVTPEGMEGLLWEDEIGQQISQPICSKSKDDTVEIVSEKDDEWSVLYRYYASVIEKTGEMLANSISTREPHCLDAFRQGPIHYAATVGSVECMELLLKHNAPVNMPTNTGHTALHLAVEQPKVIEMLLRYKANPNKLTFYDQLAAIHIAAKTGAIETVIKLQFLIGLFRFI